MTTKKQLLYVALAILAYFTLDVVSPRVASAVLMAFFVFGLVMVGKQL